ncbi:DUF11 domain-containing protein [Diaphorobacter aerolatus]|uniref:DUF11 domain-containing protein n=1 Tax=Diaphorobacter aerolatus TaxID=1288495 RepID=A0A7H0GN65_9BURK|nr:DUF11 domain-containing protein [Diaphorobacter aerolatus]QNP49731.1 DUF11 domain-containing protein [Diaphorobacter aerolatus]
MIGLPVNVTASAIAGGTGATVTNNASVGGGGDPFNGNSTPAPASTCTALDAAAPGHCATRDTRVNTPASIQVAKNNPVIAAATATGQFTATYEVSVSNNGGFSGEYTLSDKPGFPTVGVVLNGWTVTTDIGSVNAALAPAPTNNVAAPISAASVALPAGVTHRYVVTITFAINASATALVCNATPGNGAFNEASIAGSAVATDDACNALPGVPNLSITKTSNGPWMVEQANASYTLQVTNRGTVASAGRITVVDQMPAGVTATAGTYGDFNCTVSGQTVTCTGEAILGAGASSSIVLPVTIGGTAVPQVTNAAAVGGGGDPYNAGAAPVPGNCAAGDGHCASLTTTVAALANPAVSKTNNVNSLLVGGTTTYTVTISNPGTTEATGVSWTDVVGSGLSDLAIVPGAASAGSALGTCSGLTCSGITIAAGGNVTYLVNARVSGAVGTNAVNTAIVTGGVCRADAPCTSVDSDVIADVVPPQPGGVTPVPVDSRLALGLLTLLLMLMGMRAARVLRARK